MPYVAPIALIVASYISLLIGGWSTVALPLIAFVLVPILDQTLPTVARNLTPDEERLRASSGAFDLLLYSTVPLQLGIVVVFLWAIARGHLQGLELVGATATLAIACGVYGINVAHELGHRRERTAHLAAWVLLASTHYMHFYVEHNRGHHRRVATPDDPASAQRGESVYAFWLRSTTGSWRHAWTLEADRLRAAGATPWSWANQMVRFQAVQLGLIVAAWLLAGAEATALWLVASLGGILLLETVNYIEHYGLCRNKTPSGTYERVRPHHSWNSNRSAGRILLFELTRHSDHHAHASRPYPLLRHQDDAPQLPYGYPAMVLLSLVPPLFFRVMDSAVPTTLPKGD